MGGRFALCISDPQIALSCHWCEGRPSVIGGAYGLDLLDVGAHLGLVLLVCIGKGAFIGPISILPQYVRDIKEEVGKYSSVTFSWTRSHTTSNSFIALGNREADKLAKQGLADALAND